MLIFKRIQLALVFVFCAIAFSANSQELPLVVSDVLRQAGIPPYAVGAYVQEVGNGPVLAAANWGAPLSPASTMKLVTTDAALELLGPTFTWKTQALAEGQQIGDVLQGDLIIRGSGDPKLVVENLWLFLRRIRSRGIREIQGSLVLDRSAFEEMDYDASSFDGDPLKPYNAGPDALLLNYKAFSFRFIPDATTGNVTVLLDPPVDTYPVTVPRLVGGDCGDWRNNLQAAISGNDARFEGGFPLSCGERTWYIHPNRMTHAQYFSFVFRRMWRELGGVLKGEVKDGPVPPTARLVAEWESPSLAEIIRDINKYSNNVMARQVLLTIANQVLKVPGTMERGAAVTKLWLAKKGIDAPELNMDNGAGLSRTARISAITLARLLQSAYQAPTMPEFVSSLPLIGMDGTMRQRLKNQGVVGSGHIKSGTLNGVRAIAGYIQAASGRRYVVVFIVNHIHADRAQEAQDALMQWVFERG